MIRGWGEESLETRRIARMFAKSRPAKIVVKIRGREFGQRIYEKKKTKLRRREKLRSPVESLLWTSCGTTRRRNRSEDQKHERGKGAEQKTNDGYRKKKKVIWKTESPGPK